MIAFSFDNAPFSIRGDLKSAYREYWESLASPGNWWTGEERIAIAVEVRKALDCSDCKRRKQALSPGRDCGAHVASESLSPAAVDAVHRVITDQSRITQSYVDHSDLTEEAYVELVGVAVIVFSIDESMRALGLPLEPLPKAAAGVPSRYRPKRACRGIGFVSMLPRDGAVEAEGDLWNSRGRSANVLRALSLVPDAVRQWIAVGNAQYLSMRRMMNFSGDTGKALDRRQLELVAGRVSSFNECFY
jgi:alkylhydroperoxidase family enzyme